MGCKLGTERARLERIDLGVVSTQMALDAMATDGISQKVLRGQPRTRL